MQQITLLAALFLATAFPGSQELAAQQSQPPWFVVFEEKGTPGDRAQFMKAQKEAVDSWKELHSELPVFAWLNDDNTLYRVMPIVSFASIDTLYQKMEQVSQFMKAGNPKAGERTSDRSTISGTVMIWVPELSHRKKMEFSQYSDQPYTEFMYIYLLSDQEEAAHEALRNLKDYYIDKKLNYPWDTFRVLLGNDTPVMIGLFRAESPSSLQARAKKIWEKHDTELEKLWDQVVRCTWKIEKKTGWFNQSLSNIPVISPYQQVTDGL